MIVYVWLVCGGEGVVLCWQGGWLLLFDVLGCEMEVVLEMFGESVELCWLVLLLQLQVCLFVLFGFLCLLVEILFCCEGQYLFVYLFVGCQVNEGIVVLMVMCWMCLQINIFVYVVNDYGFVLVLVYVVVVELVLICWLLQFDSLFEDLCDSFNFGELVCCQFCDIVCVFGMLVFVLLGCMLCSLCQLQVFSGLLYDVLCQYDLDYILLMFVEYEVLYSQFDFGVLVVVLQCCQVCVLYVQVLGSFGLFLFLFWVECMCGQFSNEDWKICVLCVVQ